MQTRFTHRLLAGAGIVACVTALIAARPASAQTEAISSFSTTQGFQTGGFTVGYTFSLTAPVNVTSLGYFDFNADGLAESHDVAIYDSAGVQLFSATVPSGVGTTTGNVFQVNSNSIGTFRYVDFAPIALATGSYTIGGYSGASGADLVAASASSITANNPFVYGGGVATPSGGLSATAPSSLGAPNSYFGPDFRFTAGAAAVGPEPGTFVLFGTGLLSMGGVTLRRRNKKAAK